MAGGLTLPPQPPEVLTCDDIIRAGACTGGVARRLQRVARTVQIAACEAPARLMTIVPQDEHQHILSAVNQCPSDGPATCYGDGYGYGYGDGYGYGYGDGYGDGSSSDGEGSYA